MKKLGKVELHLHLDGSLDLDTAYALAKSRNVIKDTMTFDEFKSNMTVPSNNPSLEECLKCFDFPIAIMQDREALELTTYTLIRNLHELGLIYAEIRFAPQLHMQKGMTQSEVLDAVIAGRNRAYKEFGLLTNIICCAMTIGPAELNMEANLETVRVTKEFLGKGAVAVDLAGNEGVCPITDFKPVFDLAKELGVPYTIHAGEAGPASNVWDAVNVMGAQRIGHGGHSTQDPKVKQMMIDKQIPYEFCVTSNIQCHVQPSYEGHAIIELLRDGACVTMNSDNMTLSGVNIHTEMEKAITLMGFTEEDCHKMNVNAIKAAFLSDSEKEMLIAKL